MNIGTFLWLGAGLVLLVAGGEGLVRGASRLAALAGVSPLVIGLTVVAFGTSAPELVVSVTATAGGAPDLAVGNVVGSNIFNVLFILGVCALVQPLVVSPVIARRDLPLNVAVSAAVWLLALDGRLGILEGLALLLGLGAYVLHVVRAGRREQTLAAAVAAVAAPDAPAAPPRGAKTWLFGAALTVGGLALLVVGSRWMVQAAVELARALGVAEVVIGLTVVAAGTSLPEVATSVIATIRGERDIAVGNVIGSNLFNLLGILGVSALAGGDRLAVAPSVAAVDLPVMLAAVLVCWPFVAAAGRLARPVGLLLLAGQVGYTAYLILASERHPLLPALTDGFLAWVLPALALGIVGGLGVRLRRRGAAAGGPQ